MLLLFLALCLLSGCREKKSPEGALTYASAEDCFLCNRTGEPWGQNNVGLISLNTFEMMPIEIDRYDEEGKFLAERTGTIRTRSFQSGEGFQVSGIEDQDRGYAMMSVALGTVGAGLGVVNFATGEVRALDERTRGFGLGDFYIYCDWAEAGEKVELLVFYSPLRF